MKCYVWLIAAVLITVSCTKKRELANTPKISAPALSINEVQQGASDQKIRISFLIEDGDADLIVDGLTESVFLKDSRDPDSVKPAGYILPEIPNTFADPDYGFTGSAFVDIRAAFLIFKDTLNNRMRDTLTYEIYITDQAGHESNRITTNPIYITQ